MTVDADPKPGAIDPGIADRLAAAIVAVEALQPGESFNPAIPAALVSNGMHLLPLPVSVGGLGGGMAAAVDVLSALGAVDGSVALGFAMHTHVMGALADSTGWPPGLRQWLVDLVVREGALLNAASTEDSSGSPARGGLPATSAAVVEGGYRLTGEKTWTSWLPALRAVLVTATLEPGDQIGTFIVDLTSAGVERVPAFDALGMRGSASGRLRLHDVFVSGEQLVVVRSPGSPDPRGVAPQAWFGAAIAAVYLGLGEGARRDLVRWAVARRPGDGSTAVADLPTVGVRIGRMDAVLRVARTVLEDVARRWDMAEPGDRAGLMPDLVLAKITATNAAVVATDEALRIAGGPGFLAGRIERAFRDARGGLINPPIDDIALQVFAARLAQRARAEHRDPSD